jgi:3-oxoadipate enol-lactonase
MAMGDPTAWREINWAESSRSLDVLGRKMHFVSLGSGGVPLFLIHGTGGSWRHWLCNIPALASGRPVFAVDLPGFGGSDLPASEITVEGYAQTILALADRLELARFDIVGHSLGGLVAAALATRSADRMRKLVLVGGTATAILAIASSPIRGTVRYPAVAACVLAEILLGMQSVPAPLAKATASRARLRKLALGFAVHAPENLPADLTSLLIMSAGSPGFLPAIRAHRSHAPTGTIANPLLAIAGLQDRLTPSGELKVLQRRSCNLRTLVIDNAAHLPMVEQPAQFNCSVSAFLEDDAS